MIRYLIILLLSLCAYGEVIEFPSQVADLQQALDLTAAGDTVLVARGCWPVNLVTPDRDLTLCSNYLFSGDTTDILETQLDGELAGTVLTIRNTDPHSCRVVGFTIQHGMGMRRPDDPPHDFAGGLHIRELSAGELQSLRFRWNRTSSNAAAKDINSICGNFFINGEYQALCVRKARLTSCHFILDDDQYTLGSPRNVCVNVSDSLIVSDLHVSMEADSVAETSFRFCSDTWTEVEDVDIHGLRMFGDNQVGVFIVGANNDHPVVVDGLRMTDNRVSCLLLNIASHTEIRATNVYLSNNSVFTVPCSDSALDVFVQFLCDGRTVVDGFVMEHCSNNAGRLLLVSGSEGGELRNFQFNDNVSDPGTEDTLSCIGPGRAMLTRQINLRHGEFCRNISVAPKTLIEIGGHLQAVHAVSQALLSVEYTAPSGTIVLEDLLFEDNAVYDVDDPYDPWTRGSPCGARVLAGSVYAYYDPCSIEVRNVRVLHNRYYGMPYEWPYDPAWPVRHVGSTCEIGVLQEVGLARGDMFVENCLFEDNDDGASAFRARHLTVRNCQYIDNSRYALHATAIPWHHDSMCYAKVQNVFIQNTDTTRVFADLAYDVGVQVPLVVSGDSVLVENLTLVDCDAKFLTTECNPVNYDTPPRYSVWRNILVDNCSYYSFGHELHEWYYPANRFTPSLSYSCLQEETNGEGNFVVADPRFDLERGVPYLESNSPCVDAGDPDPNWQDLPDSEIPEIAMWPGWGDLRCDIGYTGGPLAPGDPWLSLPTSEPIAVPTFPTLGDAYPNPFNPTTTIPFVIHQPSHLRLAVYNLRGQLVATLADGVFPPGEHRVTFDGSSLASGVYLIHLNGEDVSRTRKVLLVK